ncbi:hypothetical protein GE09DRAFT_1056197 [Coniochaeta sp. 2T2.1]|nr:hypothetical protein GE09DRAFT_1056197 [Coniochaeta sp. 2T2.1]
MNNHKYIHLPQGHGRSRSYYITSPPLTGATGASEPPRMTICKLVPRSDCPEEYRFFPKLFVIGRQNGSMFDTARDLRRFYDLDQAVHGELQIWSALRLPLTGTQLKALRANTYKWGFEEDFFAKDGSVTLPTYHTPIHIWEYFTEGRWVGVEMDGPKGRTVRRAWHQTSKSGPRL